MPAPSHSEALHALVFVRAGEMEKSAVIGAGLRAGAKRTLSWLGQPILKARRAIGNFRGKDTNALSGRIEAFKNAPSSGTAYAKSLGPKGGPAAANAFRAGKWGTWALTGGLGSTWLTRGLADQAGQGYENLRHGQQNIVDSARSRFDARMQEYQNMGPMRRLATVFSPDAYAQHIYGSNPGAQEFAGRAFNQDYRNRKAQGMMSMAKGLMGVPLGAQLEMRGLVGMIPGMGWMAPSSGEFSPNYNPSNPEGFQHNVARNMAADRMGAAIRKLTI